MKDINKTIPRDPFILLSFVNTELRDFYSSLEEFCDDYQVSTGEISKKLSSIHYAYDSALNKFV